MGKNSVIFDCGFRSVIKAVNGTWISLCGYALNDEGTYIPFFALSAQIGNPEYVDFREKMLSENEFYILKDKKFVPVILHDERRLVMMSSRIKNDIEIMECQDLEKKKYLFCVRKGSLSACGETMERALFNLKSMKMKHKDILEFAKKLKRDMK